jgi:hypothetical protein
MRYMIVEEVRTFAATMAESKAEGIDLNQFDIGASSCRQRVCHWYKELAANGEPLAAELRPKFQKHRKIHNFDRDLKASRRKIQNQTG